MCEWHDWRSGMALSFSEHVLILIGCVPEAGAKLSGNLRGKNGKGYQPSNNYLLFAPLTSAELGFSCIAQGVWYPSLVQLVVGRSCSFQ